MPIGRRYPSTTLNEDPETAAREVLEGGTTKETDSSESDDDEAEDRGQSGTKGTGSAG
jgi:hypothetical protein